MELFLIAIFTVLAFYGLVCAVAEMFSKLTKEKYIEEIYTVVTVKDKQDSIEGIIRVLMCGRPNSGNVIIVDLGSADGTLEIARKLILEYPLLLVYNKNEYIEFLEADAVGNFDRDN